MTDTVRRYKELVAELTAGRERLRQYEQARMSELATELRAADERLRAEAEKRDRVRASATQWWNAARDLLRNTRWLPVGPMPTPEERAPDGAQPPPGGIAAAYTHLRRTLRLLPSPTFRGESGLFSGRDPLEK